MRHPRYLRGIRPRKQRAFIHWLHTQARFSVPLRIKKRRYGRLELGIDGLHPAIRIEVPAWRTGGWGSPKRGAKASWSSPWTSSRDFPANPFSRP